MVPFGVTGANTARSVAARKRAETGNATDRDADGKQHEADDQPKRNLSAEEIQEAIRFLENLQGVKDNNLIVKLEDKDDVRVVYIEDAAGKVVRRLAESDLSTVLKNRKENAQPKASGNLLNTSA